ncbi:MAG: gliding motility-associated C-terminal domain-containing protein [Salinivirgaceae bacterium]|nr:gliding motility-associated C-terminal domain-containing protein [Salinivirgaceae bacterium]
MKHFALSLLLAFVVGQMSAQTLESDKGFFTAEGPFCIGSTIKFEMSEDAKKYSEVAWDGGSFVKTNDNLSFSKVFDAAGVYTITLSGKFNSQSFSDEIDIEIFKSPELIVNTDTTIQHFTIAFKVEPEKLTYIWDLGEGKPITTKEDTIIHKYAAPGTYNYSLIAIDDNGCADSTTNSVIIRPLTAVPNAFTPNGDGNHDFYIISCDNGSKLTLEIFNRWGYRVFRRTGTENIVWDGYNPQGTLVQPGTYYYVITVEEGSTNYNPLNGYITVFY